jgi:hypothetical protein
VFAGRCFAEGAAVPPHRAQGKAHQRRPVMWPSIAALDDAGARSSHIGTRIGDKATLVGHAHGDQHAGLERLRPRFRPGQSGQRVRDGHTCPRRDAARGTVAHGLNWQVTRQGSPRSHQAHGTGPGRRLWQRHVAESADSAAGRSKRPDRPASVRAGDVRGAGRAGRGDGGTVSVRAAAGPGIARRGDRAPGRARALLPPPGRVSSARHEREPAAHGRQVCAQPGVDLRLATAA